MANYHANYRVAVGLLVGQGWEPKRPTLPKTMIPTSQGRRSWSFSVKRVSMLRMGMLLSSSPYYYASLLMPFPLQIRLITPTTASIPIQTNQ